MLCRRGRAGAEGTEAVSYAVPLDGNPEAYEYVSNPAFDRGQGPGSVQASEPGEYSGLDTAAQTNMCVPCNLGCTRGAHVSTCTRPASSAAFVICRSSHSLIRTLLVASLFLYMP